jgi:hypothetical protein
VAKPFLLLLALALVWSPLKPAAAQMICLPSLDAVKRATAAQGEKLNFVGVNAVGQVLYFFVGAETFTLFFSSDGSGFCTNEVFVGTTVEARSEELENAFK